MDEGIFKICADMYSNSPLLNNLHVLKWYNYME